MLETNIRTWTDADGYTVEILDSVGGTWIRVSSKAGKGDATSFGSNSPIQPVRQQHIDGLAKLGKNPADYRLAAGVLVRLAAVPFIESVQAAMRAVESQAAESLLLNVPGLAALRAARDDEDRYSEQFERMMENENNDGARPPKPVREPVAVVAARFPIAAAYLKAEDWECSTNYGKANAGTKAKARIAAGEDHTVVLAEMQTEWSAHAASHVD
jgi:hypothetical protein